MAEYSLMDQYWIWLSSVEGMSAMRFYQLLSVFEDARGVWDNVGAHEIDQMMPRLAPKIREARSEEKFIRLFSAMDASGMRAVPRLSDEYPALLNRIYDPPATLFVRGALAMGEDARGFSVVGSRRATRDGLRAAREFSRDLAENGVTVVSGMARGIDTAAHQGALEGGGTTVAVLGCGADVVYPPENDRLAEEILDRGGAIVSEYAPGVEPLSFHFPARNRIISGMTPGMLIVEGAAASGANITASLALEQNRDVFAVPGSIYSPMSETPNRLICEGARPALCAWDILESYRWGQRPSGDAPGKGETDILSTLNGDERALVEPLLLQEMSMDELCQTTGFPISKLNSYLTMLILRGIIVKVPGGLYRAYGK